MRTDFSRGLHRLCRGPSGGKNGGSQSKGSLCSENGYYQERGYPKYRGYHSKKSWGIDILINNAGFGSYGTVEDTTIEDARYQFEVNLFGLARLTQLAIPDMREKKAGKIINISSIGGKVYTPLGVWYHATKHALEGWSDSLRLELKPFNIDVVIIEPGLIQTEFGDVVGEQLSSRADNPAYADLIAGFRAAFEKSNGSHPSVVADAVMRAIRSKRPKTRYAAGKMAKPLLFIRRNFSDRLFGRAVMSQVKSRS